MVGNRDNPENRGLADRCLVGQSITNGALLNSTIYNNTFVFGQSRDAVVLVAEMSHEARIVRIGGPARQHPALAGRSRSATGRARPWWWTPSDFHPEQLGSNT